MKYIVLSLSILALIFGFFHTFAYGANLSGVVCTMEYAPVCASVQVQCIMAPCNPVRETFSNSCVAKASGATDIAKGACEEREIPVKVGGDRDTHGCIPSAGYTWNESQYACARPWEGKKSPQRALGTGIWILESFNGKLVTQTGTLTFGKGKFTAKLCNNMNGQYSATQSVLVFRRTISTMMYCEGDIMKVENTLVGMTRGSYMVGDTSLTITTRKGDVIVWKR